MPRSKRDRTVPLTKTKRRVGRDTKDNLLQRVRQLTENYNKVFVLSLENPRTTKLQLLRTELNDCKLLVGKNKLVARALGLSVQDEAFPNLHKVSKLLKYQRALLFTNRSSSSVLEYLRTFTDAAYARSGFKATNSIELMAGKCPQWQHSMEPALRKLGLPVKLVKGVISIERDHLVCRRGQRLTPEQCEILKLCKYEMSEFRIRPLYLWEKETGLLTDLAADAAAAGAAAASEAEDTSGKVQLISTVLDDGNSYFVPNLLSYDDAAAADDVDMLQEEGEGEEEDEED